MMGKSMGFLSLVWVVLSPWLWAEHYIIKLASYNNKENLLKQRALLEPRLKNETILIEKHQLYKLLTKTPHDKNTTLIALRAYQKVFPDAYLKKVPLLEIEQKHINLTAAMDKESNTSNSSTEIPTPITLSTSIMQPTPALRKAQTFHQMLENKTYFLCPNTIHSVSEKLLIQADFSASDVHFTTLLGNVPPLDMPYIIQTNRLYFVNNGHISPSQYNTIDTIYFEYMILSRWMKGKKIHQMRYYKKEEDARSYLESIHIP